MTGRMLLAAGLVSLGCAREAAQRPPVVAAQPTEAVAAKPEPEPEPEPEPRTTQTFTGEATYYSNRLAGRSTASGEKYDPAELTAAHRTLPFGTRVRVSRQDSPRSVVVRVNDRGPFGKPSRVIDLSYRAATELDMLRAGVVPVRVEVLEASR